MSNYSSTYTKVVEISNDLTHLIPIGTINFCNIPLETRDLGAGLPAPDGWKWLDLQFPPSTPNSSVHQLVEIVDFLLTYGFFKCTYKIAKFHEDPSFQICKVRLYAVPVDVDGARFFREWRQMLKSSLRLDKNYIINLEILLKYVDFSLAAWEIDDRISVRDFLCNLTPVFVIDAQDPQKLPLPSNEESKFYIQRWSTGSSVGKHAPKSGASNCSFGQRVKDIYNEIPSPDLSKYLNEEAPGVTPVSPIENRLAKLAIDSTAESVTIPGVKSHVYPYQARSLGLMLERESVVRRSLVPNLIPLKPPNNAPEFYFDLYSKQVSAKPNLITLPKGGILAENMGLGKTLICLGLICLTKFEISKVPLDLLLYHEIEIQESVKSLSKLSRERVAQESIPWGYYDLPEAVRENLSRNPGYFCVQYDNDEFFNSDVQPRKRSQNRNRPTAGLRKLYMCSTTLVVVPDNLFSQWSDEVKKHIQEGYLKVLCVANHVKEEDSDEGSMRYSKSVPEEVPAAISYDVILLSQSALSRSINDKLSPIMNIYWKRLIIDEGHSMHSKSSKAAQMCRLLFSERRWAVSGTPTSGLTKLYMEEDNEVDIHLVENEFNAKADLTKLGTIISNFLKMEPYYSQPKLWSQQIIAPLNRSVYGSELTFANLLNSIMVRHQPRDINVKLPHFHHEKIVLRPSFHDALSMNLFASVLAVNAVTSERTGVDYMFHQSNRQQLRRLLSNVQRATFYWTGFQQEDVQTLVDICDNALLNTKGKYNSWDIELLNKSKHTALTALRNPRWKMSQLIHELNYYVTNCSMFTSTFGVGNIGTKGIGLFGAPQLLAVKDFWKKNVFLTFSNEQEFRDKLETVSKEFWTRYWQDEAIRNKEKFSKKKAAENQANMLEVIAKPSSNHEELKPVEAPPLRKKRKVMFAEPDPVEEEDGEPDIVEILNPDIFHMGVDSIELLGTSSVKLTYLASELRENQHKKIKSIVFFEFEDSAYYLTELLEIINVKYILYANFINPIERSKNLKDFSSYDSESFGGITLIMNIAHSSHGLNIIAASCIFFINPVKKEAIEAQAIKRAHRIGQDKEVTIKTLTLANVDELKIFGTADEEGEVVDDGKLLEFMDLELDVDGNEFAAFPKPIALLSSKDSV
ncbi:DNA repair protein RAD5 [Candida viswanathii]|uniref:DNA repair protein RAD5 n=1 Tax=Candida viswanathii TaxID=5486 RepID=A0A367XMW2_9ASCO|nr:DNA repair protein RAD5 [Candida viswanathii]